WPGLYEVTRVADGSAGVEGDEVDQLLDRADQRGLEVAVAVDRREDAPPHVAWLGDAEPTAHALLPRFAPRDLRPGVHADDPRSHRLPDVDVRVPGHQHVGVVDGCGGALLLRAVDEVVEEDAEASTRTGTERPDDREQVVHPVEALDHDALHPQVVTLDPLDEL